MLTMSKLGCIMAPVLTVLSEVRTIKLFYGYVLILLGKS